jgi:hypothetical protein
MRGGMMMIVDVDGVSNETIEAAEREEVRSLKLFGPNEEAEQAAESSTEVSAGGGVVPVSVDQNGEASVGLGALYQLVLKNKETIKQLKKLKPGFDVDVSVSSKGNIEGEIGFSASLLGGAYVGASHDREKNNVEFALKARVLNLEFAWKMPSLTVNLNKELIPEGNLEQQLQ